LAEVLRIGGSRGDVVAYVRKAHRLFEDKGNVVSAVRAARVLDELAAQGMTVPAS